MHQRKLMAVFSTVVLTGGISVSQTEATQMGQAPVEVASKMTGGCVGDRVPEPKRGAQSGMETDRVTSPVAPGLRLTEFDRFEPDGWLRGDALTADLSEPGLRPEYLHPNTVAKRTPLAEQAARQHAVAGVNGDFFDIDVTGAPLGVGVDNGELLNAPVGGHNRVVSVRQGMGRLMRIFLAAEFTRGNGSRTPISDLNAPKVSPNGIALYTPVWGDASRASAVAGAKRVAEVELVDGVVKRTAGAPTEGPVAGNAVRLLGVDAGAAVLGSMRVGEHVGVNYRPRVDGAAPQTAVGGNKMLLRDGAIQSLDDTAVEPRTAAGFSADGKRMWLITVDGRQPDSRGMTELELAQQLKSFGADDAINLDGGGSSTLLARDQGSSVAEVRNSPSGGKQRPVPNGIGFSTEPGSGRLTGFRVEAASNVPNANRVLSGLTRRFRAFGHDEVGSPVPENPQWSVVPPGSGRIENGILHAGNRGDSRVLARKGRMGGETGLQVLGPLARLSTSTERIQLSGNGAEGHFQVLGQDDNGFSTWVDPSDVHLEYDPRLLRIRPDGDGFKVTGLASTAAVVTARVRDHVAHLGVTVGSQQKQLAPMDSVDGWRASAFPPPVRASLAQAEGRSGTPGLALDYSLTGSTATRAAYVNAAPALPLPAGTQKFGVWVNGDGRGGWLRSSVVDGAGVSTTVDLARRVDWNGWRYVEATIPPGLTGALRLQRLYVVEPDRAKQHRGRLVFDDLTAVVSPEVVVPQDPEPRDASVVQDGTLLPGGGGIRIAVVSDVQFTADDPNGPMVRRARRSLREALATHPDMIVIDGDFVDRGTAADFDLARRIVDSEIGDQVSWYYVPGNHETYGPGDLSEFSKRFGPTHRVVDSGSTRSVMLDSSLGSLRAGGFDQIRMLHDALRTAVTDPAIGSVAVFLHHPLRDPAPGGTSELADPKEAELLTKWLTRFERVSGKPAVTVAAHAGAFHAATVDGVQYEVNGNAGKAPAAAPQHGGFDGTSVLRIASGEAEEPIRWETKPYVDQLGLEVPEQIASEEAKTVRAHLMQGGRAVPVTYPVSADWSGSSEVHIGRVEDAAPWQIAVFDPLSATLIGLRAGEGTLGVTVNGVKRTARFTVTP